MYLGRGSGGSAFDRAHQRARFPGDENADVVVHLDAEVEAGAEDVLPEQPVFLGLCQRPLDVLDELRGIVAGVDETAVRAYGISADDQPFQHLVRIAGEQGPVHERAGLAFVRIDDDVFVFPGRVLRGLPFQPGGKSAAAAAAQIGFLHLVEHLVGRHLEQRLGERRVAAQRQVVVDAHRIDACIVANQEAHLVPVERHLADIDRFLAGVGVRIDQALNHLFLQRACDDLGNVLGLDLEVADPFRVDNNVGPLCAKAVAARDPDLDPGVGTELSDFSLESACDPGRVQPVTGRAGADCDAGIGGIPG